MDPEAYDEWAAARDARRAEEGERAGPSRAGDGALYAGAAGASGRDGLQDGPPPSGLPKRVFGQRQCAVISGGLVQP